MTINLSDPYLLRALNGIGKWARLLAIVGFVSLGLAAIGILLSLGTMATVFATQPGLESFAALGTAGLGLVFAIYLAVGFFFTYQLYRFGNAFHHSAARGTSNEAIARGFGHLATLFKVSVLFIVLGLALALVTSVLVGSAITAGG